MDPIERLGEEIAELSAHLDSATQRLLACIRAFDQAGGWERQGAVTCAHWLAWRLGLDTATAREKVRVARALAALPGIDQALARGELSYAKVRALTRVATPENEPRLLELARHATGAQLERICRGYRQVVRSAEQPELAPEERSVRERPLPGGMVRIELVLCPDEAALVMKAVEKAGDDLRSERAEGGDQGHSDVSPEASGGDIHQPTECPAISRADGVLHLAESFLARGRGASTGSGGDRYQVLLHVDQDVLAEDGAWAPTLDDGTRVSGETLRRIACDAGLVVTMSARATMAAAAGTLVRHADGESDDGERDEQVDRGTGTGMDIGRRSRSIPAAIRRALWLRDRGCRFPGCPHTRFLHGHHVQHWLHGGATRLDNLVLLCTRHHHLVHEGGFTVEQMVGQGPIRLTFRAPDGTAISAVPSRAQIEDAVESLQVWAQEHEIHIDPSTNLPWWDGAVPDYDLAVSSLLAQ